MKRNKRRIDARLKPYIWQRLEAVSEKVQTTYTEILEIALEKGLNWYINKIRREIDKNFLTETLSPKRQENDKPKPKIEEEEEPIPTNEEIQKMINEYYDKNGKPKLPNE